MDATSEEERPPASAPRRILQRAGNLLTSTGQPACKELELGSDDLPIVSSPVSLGRKKLGASIRRKFKEVKNVSMALGRSKSVSLSMTNGGMAADDGQGNARSLSHPTPTPTPPRLKHANTAPAAIVMDDDNDAETAPLPAADVTVPQLLQQGTPMTKVSSKKHTRAVFRLDPDLGQIIWESKQHRIIPLENIKELRSGSDARYYREQFQLAQEYEDRWLTIVYIIDGAYKSLHLIAATKDVFRMWDTTLRKLYAIRQELMSGLGNIEMRQAIWEKQHWKGADEEQDQKLVFEEVEKLCKRLNINSSSGELLRLFKQADTHQRNFLDFEDFRRFVKLLKGRPEIDRLYKKLRARGGGIFDYSVFEKFMQEKQKSSLTPAELQLVFDRYSVPSDDTAPQKTMTSDAFTSFLLSPDNSAFTDQHSTVWHDMTRPLADYYISSSHNTYLVGHQLVGVSTIEGYIRALLHSCRSVELDIYADPPSSPEPMITHGKTFTSKVPLRAVCAAIAKYGFVASPYPIIISAEMHCTVAGQEEVAQIMDEVFGTMLVRKEGAEAEPIEKLPSPEDLRGRILFKTKNLNLIRHDSMNGGYSTEASSTSTSASDSEAVLDQSTPGRRVKSVMKRRESDTVKELTGDLLKAGSTVLQRVRSVGKSHSRSSSGSGSGSGGGPKPFVPRTSMSLPLPAVNATELRPDLPSPSSAPIPIPPSRRSSEPEPQTPPTPTHRLLLPSSPPRTPRTPIPRTPMSPPTTPATAKPKPKMSPALLALLVYTVGVKCRGINKKEVYAPEHMFSLSESVANRMLKSPSGGGSVGGTATDASGASGMQDLIKHCRTHLVRVYPKGLRLSSSNYEPHRYWSAGTQLVAINWQTFDLGYMINHAMFQRNGRAGYVLKPPALRAPLPLSSAAPPSPVIPGSNPKDLLAKRTHHHFDVSIISAQQLPRPKDASGDKAMIDPYVEVSLHVPDWPGAPHRAPEGASGSATAARTISYRTGVVKNNGFNPVWEEKLRLPFECVGDMLDLVFVRFVVRQGEKDDVEPLAVYCASLGSLGHGYRHLPLHDSQLSQYLFSTLFVRIAITDS